MGIALQALSYAFGGSNFKDFISGLLLGLSIAEVYGQKEWYNGPFCFWCCGYGWNDFCGKYLRNVNGLLQIHEDRPNT